MLSGTTALTAELLARQISYSPPASPHVRAAATVAEVLGLADHYAAAGEYGPAENLFLQVLAVAPQSADIRLALANVYGAAGAWDRALPLLDAVLAADIANRDALVYKAQGLYHHNRVAEAVTTIEAAIALGGESGDLLNALGMYRTAAGDLAGAERVYRDAIRLDPGLVAAYHNLLDLRDADISDELVAQMKSIAARRDLSATDSALINFCISRCYRRREQAAVEFEYLHRAKSVMASQAPWDAAGFAADVAAVLSVSTNQITGFRNRATRSPAPIVICSMPRAGSTLLEQIVSSHADVASIGEAGLATRATQAAVARHALTNPLYPAWFGLANAGAVFEAAFQGFRDVLAPMAVTTSHFCEKSANNDILLGLWLLACPNAKVVHCQRDPLDICLSCYQSYFAHGVAFSNRLSWVARRYELHEQLMNHWKRLFPAQVLTVSYEDIVAQPRSETQRILNFIGLPWDDACLEFHRNQNTVRSASNWQVRQPLYQSSAHRWCRYRDQLSEIMYLAP